MHHRKQNERPSNGRILGRARNALLCGFGVDGFIALCEAIEKMPQRPPWTIYFMPPGAKVAKIKKDLKKLEDAFFAGK